MTHWDVFHSGRLEVLRGLSTSEVRAALARGEVRDDDLIRPAGTTVPWARLADLPELIEAQAQAEPEPPVEAVAPTPAGPASESFVLEPDEEDTGALDAPTTSFVLDDEPAPTPPADLGPLDLDLDRDRPESLVAPAASPGDDDLDGEAFDPLEEDEEAAEFTLSRGAAEKIAEIDMAPMVDVAFQLVLFFLVTATTVLYKTLEVPRPNPEPSPPAAAAPGAPNPQRTLEDLQADYIVVAIDPQGAFTLDREPVPADMAALARRLRQARADTGRKAMLLSADARALHRYAVIAYDAANEIGMRIAIARPATR